MIANLLYAFDVNMRAAIGLGIFGGGGIGLILLICLIVYFMGGFRTKA